MDGEVGAIYSASASCEFSFNFNGCNYLIIYGEHVNGWYIAIPNWDVSSEASNPEDVFWNTERLSTIKGLPEGAAEAIARAIKEVQLLRKEIVESESGIEHGEQDNDVSN